MWRRLREDRDVIFGWFHVSNFLADVLSIFIFALWFWLLIIIFGDLFRRHDISGWAKAIWVIALIIFPYQGIFIDLITHHRGNGLNSANENYPGCLSKGRSGVQEPGVVPRLRRLMEFEADLAKFFAPEPVTRAGDRHSPPAFRSTSCGVFWRLVRFTYGGKRPAELAA